MRAETRYVRPEQAALVEVVERALQGAGETETAWEWVETGSSNVIVLAGGTAVRVARDPLAAAEARRTQRLVDALPGLPFAVPRSRGAAVESGAILAVPTERIDGEPHPPHTGDPAALRALLEAVHGIDPAPLAPWLAPARAFCGGPDWAQVLRGRVVPLLPVSVRSRASAAVDRLEALDPPHVVLNHGDLAGANVLWREGRVVGVLDWDLAALDDPAEDLAALASWHGWDVAHRLADRATVRRAEAFRDTFALQAVAFALLNDRPEEEVGRAVERAGAAFT